MEMNGLVISRSYDNDKETEWGTWGSNPNATLIYSFDKAVSFKEIEIYLQEVSPGGEYSYDVTILGSNNKTTGYTEIATAKIYQSSTKNISIADTSQYKYIKLVMTNSDSSDNGFFLSEVKFMH